MIKLKEYRVIKRDLSNDTRIYTSWYVDKLRVSKIFSDLENLPNNWETFTKPGESIYIIESRYILLANFKRWLRRYALFFWTDGHFCLHDIKRFRRDRKNTSHKAQEKLETLPGMRIVKGDNDFQEIS